MKLKSQEQAAAPQRPGISRPRVRRFLVAGAVIALVAWTGLAFVAGIAFLDFLRPSIQSLTGFTSSRDVVDALSGAPYRFTHAWLSNEEVPRLHLDIKFKHLHKLHQKRDAALAKGLLQSSGDDFVPAEIRIGDRTVRVKLRLKGDYTDHLEGEKWSMRVHVKGSDQLFGMRRFSLQAPRTRAFQAEPIVLDHYRREGVLAPRYFFVDVSLNGDDIGLMAVEESFSKELLESNQRREGVIIRFDEDPFFANQLRNGIPGVFENFYTARITPFGSSTIRKSEKLTAQLQTAIGLLRGFLDGRLPASDVFDIESTGRFLAVSEVWGAMHALRWHNLRFYLNPITLHLEPIAFDINMQATYVGTGMVSLSEHFPRLLLEDSSIREAFVRDLRRVAGEMRDGEIATRVAELETTMLSVLSREFPLRSAMKMNRLERRAAILASVSNENFDLFRPELVQPLANYPEAIHAHIEQDASGPYLEFINVLSVPVSVHSLMLSVRDSENDQDDQALQLVDPSALPITLPGTALGQNPTPIKIRYVPSPSLEIGSAMKTYATPRISGRYQVSGQRRRHAFEAKPYFAPLSASPTPSATLEEALAQHAFLRFDEAHGLLRAAPGEHRVTESIVLPPGIGLELEPGTTLRFAPRAALVASGQLVFHGSANSPIVLEGEDSDSLWAGVVALHSSKPHSWKNVVVRHTSGISLGAWTLTGGVTLRDAQVRIEDSVFESNRCEDALNLVRSTFELINVRFIDTPSDAFDGDFVQGRIVGGSYEDIGGDGIDISGAEVEIEGVSLARVHDKALSIGEGSHATISDVRVHGAGTALASKDASRTEITGAEFSDIEFTAIMAYVKKPEYGPSQIVARDIIFHDVRGNAMAQIGSRISLNEIDVEPEAIDIKGLYDSGYMRK